MHCTAPPLAAVPPSVRHIAIARVVSASLSLISLLASNAACCHAIRTCSSPHLPFRPSFLPPPALPPLPPGLTCCLLTCPPLQMTVNITCDHRTVYGAHAAEFLQSLKAVIESPDQLVF